MARVHHNFDKYELVAEQDGVEKFERTVRTPGWSGEAAECKKTLYRAFGRVWKVSRISTKGWNVSEYDEDGRPVRRSSSDGYFDSAEAAHECAKSWVMEVGE